MNTLRLIVLLVIIGIFLGCVWVDTTVATDGQSLLLSTYLGGSGKDTGYSVAVDSAGNIYVAGTTNSTNFPMANPYLGSLQGTSDGFIARFDPTGTDLQFSTYLGGSYDEDITSLTVGNEGFVYVTGWTNSRNYPVTPNAFDKEGPSGSWDAFLSIIDTESGGSAALVYSTYLGGSNMDKGTHVDRVGDYAYVTGYTASPNFPLANAVDNNLSGYQDAFAFAILPGDSVPLFSTYFGGSSYEACLGADAYSDGSLYFAGWTSSSDFPTTTNSTFNGIYDLFVVKLTPSGRLGYSMMTGGTGKDIGWSVTSDGDYAFVAGSTTSTNFPVTSGAIDSLNQGGTCGSDMHICKEGFLTKIDQQGKIAYSTYLGGRYDDTVYAIERWNSNIVVVGGTNSEEYITTADAYDSEFNGNMSLLCEDGLPCLDAFLTILSDTGALQYSTFLGALREDIARGLWITSLDRLYVAGSTENSGFPTTEEAYDMDHNGWADVFLTALNIAGTQIEPMFIPLVIK